MELTFELLLTADDPRLKEVSRIYIQSFPADERKPFQLLKQQVSSGKSRLWIATANGEVLLMALYSQLSNPDFSLLEYMAVSPKARNQQVGSQFLAFLLNQFRDSGQYLLLEIEHPEQGDNQPQRKKRLDFYLSNGAYLLQNVPYKLPSFGSIQPIDMLLLIAPQYGNGQIPGALVQSLARSIYTDLYGKKPHNTDLASFIDKIPENVHLMR
jgi:GNAT superfamily N-acetyltransferase